MMSSWGLIGRGKGVTLEISENWSKTTKAEKQFEKKTYISIFTERPPKQEGPEIHSPETEVRSCLIHVLKNHKGKMEKGIFL